MIPAQQMKRITFGNAALRVRMRIWKRAHDVRPSVYLKTNCCVCSYVILLEVAHVADDSNPHKHGSCSKEDAANIVACDDLAEAGGGLGESQAAAVCMDLLVSARTLFWISILRMEPMMLSVSLTMMRMYQPLTNSSLSDQGASLPLLLLQYWVYSCLQHQDRGLVAGTDVFFLCVTFPLHTAGESRWWRSACRGWRSWCRSQWWDSQTSQSGRGPEQLKERTIENECAFKSPTWIRFGKHSQAPMISQSRHSLMLTSCSMSIFILPLWALLLNVIWAKITREHRLKTKPFTSEGLKM